MRKRYQKKQVSPLFNDVPQTTILPIERPVAIYYRQSTLMQVGNISTSIQTVDMVTYLKQCGWNEEHIIMIDMDAGVSGSVKIDERPGMSTLFELITEHQIGAVACQDEDRLFRDVTQIQVNIFIEACRQAQVLVITPSIVYDFANELTGTFHARQFRFKSEMAAEYINAVVRGKLHRARRRIIMSGRWGGAGMPLGFMVDTQKTLPDGRSNDDWRKYAIFEPFAEVIREYFKLFLSFSGNARKTVRHIKQHGPYYPDLATCAPPEGYRVVYRIRKHVGYPVRTSLIGILTNAQYIGHWMVNGVIIIWNNHPAIVDEAIFMKAFNYLSKVTLDGNENKKYKPSRYHARPTKDENRPVDRPLCTGIVVSQDEGKWRNVGTYWVDKLQHYTYTLWSTENDKYVWSKAAPFFDEAISRLLHSKLRATFNKDMWESVIDSFSGKLEKQQKQKQKQLNHLQTVMDNLIVSLETLTSQPMILATQKRFETAEEEYQRLQSDLADADLEASRLEQIYQLKDSYEPVLENWSNLTGEEKRVIVRTFIDRIEATPLPDHALRLVVCWRDKSVDELVLPRQATTGTWWLPDETELLLKLVQAGASQIGITQAFPDRKWKDIRNKYWRETGNTKGLKFRPKLIKDEETYIDYIKRVEDDDDSSNDDSFSGGGSVGGSVTAYKTHTYKPFDLTQVFD